MLATWIVVFREVLEASLIVSVVLAATRGVARRGLWIAGGCAVGVLGAMLVAGFAAEIAALIEGSGQELFNAGVLFAAVAMLGWHNIWMSRHGRQLAAEARTLGEQIKGGARPLRALALVCAIAVLREGSEVVLFLYGIAVAGNAGLGQMVLGGVLGVMTGGALGAALYFGLVAIPMRYLFGVTSLLILLLAAGLASQGAAFLAAANILPSLGESLWNTSGILNESSLVGQMLHVLIGYTARPEGIQLVFYVGTLLLIGLGMRISGGHAHVRGGHPQRRRHALSDAR